MDSFPAVHCALLKCSHYKLPRAGVGIILYAHLAPQNPLAPHSLGACGREHQWRLSCNALASRSLFPLLYSERQKGHRRDPNNKAHTTGTRSHQKFITALVHHLHTLETFNLVALRRLGLHIQAGSSATWPRSWIWIVSTVVEFTVRLDGFDLSFRRVARGFHEEFMEEPLVSSRKPLKTFLETS